MTPDIRNIKRVIAVDAHGRGQIELPKQRVAVTVEHQSMLALDHLRVQYDEAVGAALLIVGPNSQRREQNLLHLNIPVDTVGSEVPNLLFAVDEWCLGARDRVGPLSTVPSGP